MPGKTLPEGCKYLHLPRFLNEDTRVPIRSAQDFSSFVVVGIDHRSATIAQRERVAFRSEELPGALSNLAEIDQEGFILSTCNRVEIYALMDGATPARLVDFLE